MIVSAKEDDIPKIMEITRACAKAMIAAGIYQWNEHYPSEEKFAHDIARDELYVNVNHEGIVGTIVISTLMDEEYIPIQWLTPSDGNIYIHRLCVHPDYWGQGLAQKAMSFAENHARKMKAPSVRLDTFSQNKRNHKFYEARGYVRLGDIFFPKQSDHPFHCYELVL